MRQIRRFAALGAAVFVAFWFQHARSPFLRIEADATTSTRVAAASGLDPLDVMALRELHGLDLTEAELERIATEFAADRARFGSAALAAIASTGHRDVVLRLFDEVGGDARHAEALLRTRPEAIDAVRLRAVRARFAERDERRRGVR